MCTCTQAVLGCMGVCNVLYEGYGDVMRVSSEAVFGCMHMCEGVDVSACIVMYEGDVLQCTRVYACVPGMY